MRITLKLFGSFRRYLPARSQGHACAIAILPDESVADVLRRFGVPTEGTVTLINGRMTNLDQTLKEGDVLAAFPALAGGAPSRCRA